MRQLLFLFCFLIVLNACKDDNTVKQPELNSSPSELSFGTTQESKQLTIIANVAWTASSSESWCTILPASGNGGTAIVVTAGENGGVNTRTAIISITFDKLKSKDIPVSQLGLEPLLILETDNVSLGVEEQDIEIGVTTNMNLEIILDVDWVHLLSMDIVQNSIVTRKLRFHLDANTNPDGRLTEVVIKHNDGELNKKIAIVQMPSAKQADSLSLILISDLLYSDTWAEDKRWDITKPMVEWYGVTLDETTGKIKRLELSGLTFPEGTTLPKELAKLKDLESLRISTPTIGGTIPPELGQLTKLTHLSFFNCSLVGNIPSELGNLTQLELLRLSKNKLTGPIPSSFENLIKLKILMLSDNQLNGEIPVGFKELSQLEDLSLIHNLFEGSIPMELGQLNNLKDLMLFNNKLEGEIPVSILNNPNWSLWKGGICPQKPGYGFTNCN